MWLLNNGYGKNRACGKGWGEVGEMFLFGGIGVVLALGWGFGVVLALGWGFGVVLALGWGIGEFLPGLGLKGLDGSGYSNGILWNFWYNSGMAFIRKFKTASGATGVQVCYKEQGKVVKTVHIGSANSENGLKKLTKKAQGIIDKEKNPLFRLSDFDE